MKTPSINARQMLTVVVGVITLVATHALLDVLHTRSTLNDISMRLEEFARVYAQGVDVAPDGSLLWSGPVSPDHRFEQPSSGLHAAVYKNGQFMWGSSSLGSARPKLLEPKGPMRGDMIFSPSEPKSPTVNSVLVNKISGTGEIVSVVVSEDPTFNDLKMSSFTYAIWGSLWVSIILILLAQSITARWTIKPLRDLNADLKDIQSGRTLFIQKKYPAELAPITVTLNALIAHETHQSDTHRDALANLAHSLKTPLAVMRSAVETQDMSPDALRVEVAAQVARMNDLVSYQLSVAGRTGPSVFAPPELIEPIALDLVSGLEKIHKGRGVLCEFDIQEEVEYRAARGDIQELLGNLLENAFKWSDHRVMLTVGTDSVSEVLRIVVEDDGPGVPPDRMGDIIQRGVRADERIQGHGIGLAIVNDIVSNYKGQLRVDRSPDLGGALFEVVLPLSAPLPGV